MNAPRGSAGRRVTVGVGLHAACDGLLAFAFETAARRAAAFMLYMAGTCPHTPTTALATALGRLIASVSNAGPSGPGPDHVGRGPRARASGTTKGCVHDDEPRHRLQLRLRALPDAQ